MIKTTIELSYEWYNHRFQFFTVRVRMAQSFAHLM